MFNALSPLLDHIPYEARRIRSVIAFFESRVAHNTN
jgi:hypothetical protein